MTDPSSTSSTGSREQTVVVAILTYLRPQGLARVLQAVTAQAAECHPPASILVIDNDPAGGAQSTVEQAGSGLVRYVHEPRPGIAAARNRALDESAGFDLLAFIDDDEVPGPGWLDALITGWHVYQCAAVTGPVDFRFEQPVDDWIVASRFFERRQLPTGTVMRGAATNNLLLDLRVLRDKAIRFDSSTFELTMGEDTRLTYELVRRGEQVRWIDEAEVVELVPPTRSTSAWVRRRIYSAANSWGRIHLDMAPNAGARAVVRIHLTARAGWIVTRAYALGLAAALRRDTAGRIRSQCEISRGSGLLSGLWGTRAQLYRRPSSATGRTGGGQPDSADAHAVST